MLTTNLLPQSAQKVVRLEEVRRIVRFFAYGIVLVIAVGLVLLSPPYFLNIMVRQELEHSRALEEEASMRLDAEKITAKIAAVNLVMGTVKTDVSAPSSASQISSDIFDRAGQGIKIQQLAVDSGDGVAIKGLAATRRDLLNFEKRLRESELFQDTSSPIRNIIKETNIVFDIQARLKHEFGL